MSNDLTIPGNVSLVPQNLDENDISSVIASGDYLKRLQLMGANSEAVKDGKIGMGSYALVTDKENMKDLGKEIDVLVCSFRFKAMQISDDGSVINSYDPKDPEFTRIKDVANADSESGCMCGLDFLLWLPTENCFATFFMASKSARREAPNVRAKINEKQGKPGPATFGSKLVKKQKYSWHVTTVSDCTTEFDLPVVDDLIETVRKFQNPPKNEVETVKETTTRAR